MIVSFALTEREFLDGKKICTRRRWKPEHATHWKAGTLHQAWSALPYVNGARFLGTIRATRDAYEEPLRAMTAADLEAEGGMCASVKDFITLVEGTPDEKLWVAWFEVVEYAQTSTRPGSRCGCGKVIHASHEVAQAEIDRILATDHREHQRRKQRLEPYRCQKFGNWHVGHRPTTGRRSRGHRRPGDRRSACQS